MFPAVEIFMFEKLLFFRVLCGLEIKECLSDKYFPISFCRNKELFQKMNQDLIASVFFDGAYLKLKFNCF